MLAIGFINFNMCRDSETIEGAISADFRRRFPASQKIVLCLYVYFYLRVKEICSSYLDFLKQKNRPFNSDV